MNAHLDDARIHDYLDDELTARERDAVEAHAGGCSRCAERLADLAEVRTALGGLPRAGRPAADLWPEIQKRIETGPDVLPLPGATTPPPPPAVVEVRRGFPKLAYAAGLLLAFAAGGLTWRAAGPAPATGPGTPVPLATAPDPLDGRFAATTWEEAILDLEALLEEGRDRLDPVTVQTLEESLEAIDRAIREAEEALTADPESELIRAMLLDKQRAKYRVLSRAADALLARS